MIDVTINPLVIPELFHLPLSISLTWAPPSIWSFSLSSLGTSANLAPSIVKEFVDATTSVVPRVFLSVALRVFVLPSLIYVTSILSPGLFIATCSWRLETFLISTPLISIMTSPDSSPASNAAPPVFTLSIKTPVKTGKSFSLANSALTSIIVIPRSALWTTPYSTRSWKTFSTRFEGIAKEYPANAVSYTHLTLPTKA